MKNEAVLDFKNALDLIILRPQIFTFALLFLLPTLVYPWIKIPGFLSLGLTILSFGWFGAKVEYLFDAYKGKAFLFSVLWKRLIHYLKVLFPGIIVIFIVFAILFGLFIISYLTWFQSNQGELSQVNVISNFFSGRSVNNFLISQPAIFLLSQVITSALLLISTTTVVVLVIQKLNLMSSFRKAVQFLIDNRQLILIILALDLTKSFLSQFFIQLFSASSTGFLFFQKLLIVFNVFFGLLITSFILVKIAKMESIK